MEEIKGRGREYFLSLPLSSGRLTIRAPTLSLQGGVASPLRLSNVALQILYVILKGMAEAALDCAHRTSTVSSCAFCEQGGHLAAPSFPCAIVFLVREVYSFPTYLSN
jgi:hypothetical protein